MLNNFAVPLMLSINLTTVCLAETEFHVNYFPTSCIFKEMLRDSMAELSRSCAQMDSYECSCRCEHLFLLIMLLLLLQ